MNERDHQVLKEKIAVVTGGGRGIGFGISRRLASMGATVVICGRNLTALEDAADTIRNDGGMCEAAAVDITSAESVEALARQLSTRWGRCDVLINNAGVGTIGKVLHETAIEEFDRMINTNLRGAYLCMRALVPSIIATGGGHVINISSIAGRNPLPKGAAYSASKWGLNGLSYSAAEELRASNVRVSVIFPGSTQSDFSPLGAKDPDKMLHPENIAEIVALIVTQPRNMFVSEVVVRPAIKP